MTDGSGRDGSQEVTIRRMEEGSLDITRDTLKRMPEIIIMKDEGIVYCPIPKVMILPVVVPP